MYYYYTIIIIYYTDVWNYKKIKKTLLGLIILPNFINKYIKRKGENSMKYNNTIVIKKKKKSTTNT